MAKQTITPRLAKWGLSAKDMTANGPIAVPVSLDVAWRFDVATAGGVISPIIPPQGLIQPGRSEVDIDLYVVWASVGAGGATTQKVGWIVGYGQVLEDSSIESLAGLVAVHPNAHDLYRDDDGEVDWGIAGPPDIYQNYPYMQYGLAYGLAGDLYTIHKTKVTSFKIVNGILTVDPNRRSLGKIAGTINGKQVFATIFIWRAQSGHPMVHLPAVFGSGVFDVDGDGAKDTDDYADSVVLWGVVGEFK